MLQKTEVLQQRVQEIENKLQSSSKQGGFSVFVSSHMFMVKVTLLALLFVYMRLHLTLPHLTVMT